MCLENLSVMPPRASPHLTSHKILPYLASILFFSIFIFKLDIILFQSISRPPNPRPSVGNGTFNRHFYAVWGGARVRFLEDGECTTLSLDKSSGSGIESKKEFWFGKFDMQMKLIPGNSAGTVTTFYLSTESEGDKHDKIVFRFLGNSSGNPYTLHTDLYIGGKGDREQQFRLWFDRTVDFHTYSILWNPKCIVFYVDNIPIREYKNLEKSGGPYPKDRPMRVYSNLWNSDEWATQGGRVGTDWALAPFTATLRNFAVDGCVWSFRSKTTSCSAVDFATKRAVTMELDRASRDRMKRVQQESMVYDYCKDPWRFAEGPGIECRIN